MNTAPMQIGPYRLVAEIGHGEIGLVYHAVDTLYERPVALKILRSHVAQDLVLARHFVSSGREAMRLRHPNIVRVYDAGQADGLFYVAMDLVNAPTLEVRLAKTPGAWDGAAALAVVEQAGAALEYAHRRGLVHHNLKPNNLFVGEDGHVLVSDFDGIPANAGENGHPLYYRLKSPIYLAPEQARGDDQIGAAADIYSLAAIAYRLLTGRPPVGGGNALNLLWRIAEEQPKRADEVQPSISTTVADALAAALVKDPEQRIGQVSVLVRGLGGAPLPPRSVKKGAPSEPVLAPPASPTATRPPASIPYVPPPLNLGAQSAYQEAKPQTPEYVPPPVAEGEVEPLSSLSPAIVALWQRATRTARRAEPMALPALTLMAIAGLVALLLIIAAMRVAGTLIARMADENAKNTGQIFVILPTVTPTPELLAEANNIQQVKEMISSGPPTNDGGDGNGDGETRAGKDSGEGAVQMVVIVTETPTEMVQPVAEATDTALPPTPTSTETWTPLPSSTPTETPTSTETPTPTDTPTPVPTDTPTVTPTPTMTPAPTADVLAGHLAYTLWNPHSDRPEIWVWDLTRRVNNPPLSNFRQPDFSANGTLVANGYGGGGLDNLATMGLFGEGAQLVSAHSEDSHPNWSLDGKMIVYDAAVTPDGQYRIYLQNDLSQHNDGPPIKYAGFDIYGRYPVFLADGRIAYNGCNYWQNGSTCGVYVLSIDGAQPINATGWPSDIPTDNLGTSILFMSDRQGSWDIYSMNEDGSDLRQLTNLPGSEGLAAASPDGQNITYLTNQDGVWSFYVMLPDGSNIRKLFDLPGNFGRGENDWFQERISWGR